MTWHWMIASGGFPIRSDPDLQRFHAYDEEGRLACQRHLCLAATERDPNEGDELCRDCADVVRGIRERAL